MHEFYICFNDLLSVLSKISNVIPKQFQRDFPKLELNAQVGRHTIHTNIKINRTRFNIHTHHKCTSYKNEKLNIITQLTKFDEMMTKR